MSKLEMYDNFWRHTPAAPKPGEDGNSFRTQKKMIQEHFLELFEEIAKENDIPDWRDHIDPELTYRENKNILMDHGIHESPFKCDRERERRIIEQKIADREEQKDSIKKPKHRRIPPEYRSTEEDLTFDDSNVTKETIGEISNPETTDGPTATSQDSNETDEAPDEPGTEPDDDGPSIGDENDYTSLSLPVEAIEFMDRVIEEHGHQSRREVVDLLIKHCREYFEDEDGDPWPEWTQEVSPYAPIDPEED